MRTTRDSEAKLQTWKRVDAGLNALLLAAIAGSVLCVVLGFAGLLIGCATPGETDGVQWPPDVEFCSGAFVGYVDVEVDGTVQRLALDTRTTGSVDGDGVRLVGWGVNSQLAATINGRVQSVSLESTNRLESGSWIHCFEGGIAIEYAESGTVKASGIPPGFSAVCGPPGVEVSVPFLGWGLEFKRGGGPQPTDRPGEGDPADPDRSDSPEPVVPPLG